MNQEKISLPDKHYTSHENGKAYIVKVERELRLLETPLSVSVDFVGPDYPTLCCPICCFEYTHQESVDVHFRGEDEKGIPGYHVDRNGVRSPAELPNPSARRDGLFITFSCEGCSVVENESDDIRLLYCLSIEQHKGNTFVRWYQLIETHEKREIG